jgi:hypothetical protein
MPSDTTGAMKLFFPILVSTIGAGLSIAIVVVLGSVNDNAKELKKRGELLAKFEERWTHTEEHFDQIADTLEELGEAREIDERQNGQLSKHWRLFSHYDNMFVQLFAQHQMVPPPRPNLGGPP